jgi:hypothetical protein
LIRELGLPYTYIDVGWWKQITLPYPPSFVGENPRIKAFYNFYGEGKTPFIVTDREVIGDFVGRIIKDERTLNQYVVIHEAEVNQAEVWKIAEEESPEGAEIVANKITVRSILRLSLWKSDPFRRSRLRSTLSVLKHHAQRLLRIHRRQIRQ